jgi:hypothetical protein
MMNSENTQYGTGDASCQAAGEYAGIKQRAARQKNDA